MPRVGVLPSLEDKLPDNGVGLALGVSQLLQDVHRDTDLQKERVTGEKWVWKWDCASAAVGLEQVWKKWTQPQEGTSFYMYYSVTRYFIKSRPIIIPKPA